MVRQSISIALLIVYIASVTLSGNDMHRKRQTPSIFIAFLKHRAGRQRLYVDCLETCRRNVA